MKNRILKPAVCVLTAALFVLASGLGVQASGQVPAARRQNFQGSGATSAPTLAQRLGVEFIKGSTDSFVLEQGGKRYFVDLKHQTVRELVSSQTASDSSTHPPTSTFKAKGSAGALAFQRNCSSCHGSDGRGVASLKTPDFTNPRVQAGISNAEMLSVIKDGKPGTMMPAFGAKLPPQEIAAIQTFVRSLVSGDQANAKPKPKVYEAGDDLLFVLPTGRRLKRHGLYLNFAHRFPFDPAFSGTARGGALLGLDGVAVPSFGFRFGVTSRLTVGIYREPSLLGRPIQLSAGYNLLDEHDGNPLNLAVRFAVQGQNDFLKNYTESIEGIASRSLGARAQLYLVPTLSFNNRPLQLVNGFESSDILNLPGFTTFSLGAGGALDIRPTVALIAEVIPTLANGRQMGILRPAFSFGIQKKIWRHAFTFGFTTAPGVSVADRAGTRASFLGQPNADTLAGLFVGFDLTRQLF